jgi:glycosyltransferase involved in cell wall biosynthesis
MQEMKKRSIVLASVLKPVNDSRMTKKMAVSLHQSERWNVHVIGFGVSNTHLGIVLHGLGTFGRFSVSRLLAPWRIFFKTISIKPDVLIITTHELLLVSILMKLFSQTKICYDIQENYFFNILNTNAFPAFLRPVIALYVRAKETLLSPIISEFILAEKCYSQELPFLKTRFTILENKSLESAIKPKFGLTQNLKLLFSGTLDDSTGVFDAIKLAKQLHESNANIELIVVGYAARHSVRQRLHALAVANKFIGLVGINSIVPHQDILKIIATADFGVISYPEQAHTQNRIPTKLYEYLANQLPILYDATANWADLIKKSEAGIAVKFQSPDVEPILEAMRSRNFYPTPVKNVTWKSEETALLKVLGTL